MNNGKVSLSELARGRGEWLKGEGPESDIVISSRIRLARNLSGFPFLTKCTEAQRLSIQELVVAGLNGTELTGHFAFFDLNEMSEIERQLLVERHLISRHHAEGSGARGVALVPDESVALMINEEDHLRMQVLRSGFRLDEAWAIINRLDDQLEARLEFAFDEKLGYLTACPTNIGTGLRVSVMVHLPALKITGEIERVLRAARDMNLAVRGLYGEGTEATGDFYQVSNQTTLGKTEEEIIQDFRETVVPKIAEYERKARAMLLDQRTALVEDKVWRAVGMLKFARTLSTEEAMFLLSQLRMGVHMGIVRGVGIDLINDVFLVVQSAHLQVLAGQTLDGDQRSRLRAEKIREQLGRHLNN